MAATTPIGRRTTSTRAAPSSWITSRGSSRSAKYFSQTPAPITSVVASASGLPCSRVRIRPISSDRANIRSAAACSALRRAASSPRQPGRAAWAAAIAASSCSREASGARSATSPVAGSTTPNVPGAATAWPPMVIV